MAFSVQCKKCLHYRNEWCKKKLDSPDPNIVRDCLYYSTATNADSIRSMTCEELAETLCLIYGGLGPVQSDDGRAWLDWLRQEVQDDV